MDILKTLEEKTGVHIELKLAPVGEADTSFSLMMASGNIADIIIGFDSYYKQGGDAAIDEGIIYDLKDMVDQYAPNYKAAITASSYRERGTVTDEGNMLALGRTDGRFFGQNSAVFGFSPLGPEDAFDRILPMVHGNDESVSLAGFEFGCGVFCDLITRLATEVED